MRLADLTPTPATPPNHPGSGPDSDSSIPFLRKLGRTDLTVSCIGIGGGGSLPSDDVLYAFDRGINYFFFSSDLHHHAYSSMTEALRQLCGRGAAVRERVVLATVTYIKHPDAALAALFDQFTELGIDYVDLFFWGWVDECDRSLYPECLKLSRDMRGANSVYQRTLERIVGTSEKLKKMGAVRYVGTSFHSLQMAQEWMHSSLLDVIMVRHNPAHRSAQSLIFQPLQDNIARPGIVTFKSTGVHSALPLWLPPSELPRTCVQPTVPDFYRYSLSQRGVDVCLTGLQRRQEVDAAIAAIQQGKLTAAELDYLNIYGDLHRQRIQISDVPGDRLLHQTQ